MSDGTKVQWPAHAVDADGQDVAGPTLMLLRDLEFLPKASDQKDDAVRPLAGTPYSLQVISAGALSFNKWWSSVIALVGGGGAIWAGIQAYMAKQNASVQVALVSAAAFLGGIALLAVALIVRSDVDARTRASVAEYAARADVANVFLRLAKGIQGADAAPSGAHGLWATVQAEGSDPYLVIDARRDQDHTDYLLARGDQKPKWRSDSDITAWDVEPTP